jgi:hypothetical protein
MALIFIELYLFPVEEAVDYFPERGITKSFKIDYCCLGLA